MQIKSLILKLVRTTGLSSISEPSGSARVHDNHKWRIKEKNIYLISDEVYGRLVYEKKTFYYFENRAIYQYKFFK